MRLHYNKYTLKKGVQKVKTKTGLAIMTLSLALGGGSGLALLAVNSAHADSISWSLNGSYTFNFDLNGSYYLHDATISNQDVLGNFSISGGYPAGSTSYQDAWSGTGTVSGNTVTIGVNYTAGATGTHMDMTGTIDPNGTISGSWSDNYGGSRTGTWTTIKSSAKQISQVIVTPSNTQGWGVAESDQGGAVSYTSDSTVPGSPHLGALGLTTTSSTSSKEQYLHAADLPLSNLSEVGYWTKQISASFTGGDPSYQLVTCLNGVSTVDNTCEGYTTLVYEPYQGSQGTVTPNTWQQWNIGSSGLFWSSRAVTCSNGSVIKGAGGSEIYSIADIQSLCPNAVVEGFGLNVGSNNPSYNVEADLVDFNGTTYNFEPYVVPSNKDQCKNGGWQNLKANDGTSFKNQGLCVSYVASDGQSEH